MRKVRIKRKKIATDKKHLSAAVLFFVGLTVFFIIFYGKPVKETEQNYESSYTIVKESLAGREEIPLEEYLIGALAVSLPEGYEAEACKAQAVLLRTNVERAVSRMGSDLVSYEALRQESMPVGELYERWGTDYEKQYEKLKAAAEDTKGQTLHYEGIPVELPFFPLSAGKTRDPYEALAKGSFPYLASVACREDVFAEEYRQETLVSKSEFQNSMRQIFGTQEEILPETLAFTEDSAGYVTEARWNEKTVSGEAFRKQLGLSSAHFTIEENENQIVIVTKGIGHGLGMSLYTANEMAKEGKDYREILAYFFPACEIVKN